MEDKRNRGSVDGPRNRVRDSAAQAGTLRLSSTWTVISGPLPWRSISAHWQYCCTLICWPIRLALFSASQVVARCSFAWTSVVQLTSRANDHFNATWDFSMIPFSLRNLPNKFFTPFHCALNLCSYSSSQQLALQTLNSQSYLIFPDSHFVAVPNRYRGCMI